MAATGDAKGFKQDMVVSIRYRNDLPPPPMPPKLLDLDTGGLAQYLTTGYASSLAKREEPNIEVDAEGGMPIDMIGVPGYFLGDESAIMAPEIQPVLDPADHALMLSLDQLKSQGAKNNVSFLRKTQYMTASQAARVNDPFVRPSPKARKASESKVPPVPVSRDDPENIKRHIQKAFDMAYPESVPFNPPEAQANPVTSQEREAWRNPAHPDNPRLKPVEYYPILPDLDAGTDMGGSWTAVKFDKPPLPPYRGRKDERIDVGLLMASENSMLMPAWQAKKDAFDKNPDMYDNPGNPPFVWSLQVPKQPESASHIRKIFDDAHPEKDEPLLFAPLLEESADGSQRLAFERVRNYVHATQDQTDPHRILGLSIVNADQAGPRSRFRGQGSAAYYYPILERVRLKADRSNLNKTRTQAADDELGPDVPDQLMVLFREPDPVDLESRGEFRGLYDATFADRFEDLKAAADAHREATRAEESLQEQAALRAGAQDVSMADEEADDEAKEGMNGTTHQDRDDDTTTPHAAVNGDDTDDGDGDGMRDD